MGTVGGGHQAPRLLSIPKEGERILAPTRRPDGTLRKPVRIRAGYVPQDEVAIYQSKGALLRKEAEPEYPPGYDVAMDGKAKTRSAKRNERKKEKKHQQATLASLEDEWKNKDTEETDKISNGDIPSTQATTMGRLEYVEIVTEQIHSLSISRTPAVPESSGDLTEISKPETSSPDPDKRIRALKKKIRLAEAQAKGEWQNMKPGQLEKMAKVESWRGELKLLEDKKANIVS